MANRRMFSKSVSSSGKFLMMPHEAQALYFHLCLNADDDGVVEALTVMRMTGANEDVLKVLAAKQFIKILNNDLVTYILDWNEHNLLRADRKIDSIYKQLLVQIMPQVKLLRAKKRADTNKKTAKRNDDLTGINAGRPVDDRWTSNGPLSIGKDRVGKDNIIYMADFQKEFPDIDVKYELDRFETYCQAHGKKYKNQKAAFRNWLKSDYPKKQSTEFRKG